jgi:hypothetical protein
VRHRLNEDYIRDKSGTKVVSEFLRRVKPKTPPETSVQPPQPPPPPPTPPQQQQTLVAPKFETETPQRHRRRRSDSLLSRDEGEYTLDIPYSLPKLLDTRYGISKVGDTLMIGDSPMYVDTDGNITIKGTQFKGTERLCALLTRKNVGMEHVGKMDLRTYKKILKTNAHLTGYRQGDTLK